jgi:hypothetical protein
MAPENQASPPGNQRLVKWAAILAVVVIAAWLISYVLGVQIYDAAKEVTH